MTLLRSVESLAHGRDEVHYPVSPKLQDPAQVEIWRQNILKTGTSADIERYAAAMEKPAVREKLGLTDNHGS